MSSVVVAGRMTNNKKFLFIQKDFISYEDTCKNVRRMAQRELLSPRVILMSVPK